MTEVDELAIVAKALEDIRSLLRGHFELGINDAPAVLSDINALIGNMDLAHALEQVKLRSLSKTLK